MQNITITNNTAADIVLAPYTLTPGSNIIFDVDIANTYKKSQQLMFLNWQRVVDMTCITNELSTTVDGVALTTIHEFSIFWDDVRKIIEPQGNTFCSATGNFWFDPEVNKFCIRNILTNEIFEVELTKRVV
jgi:hypothetical protein